ncbi:hypothetical protein GEMRC1_006961 [Eukaryota sp. GEM-RC1]
MSYSFNERSSTFISSPIESCKLLGQPGAGKSLCIFYFLKVKIESNLLSFPHDFIILTFSRTTVTDLLRKAARFDLGEYFNSKNIRTFHSLAGTICHARGVPSSMRSCLHTATELLQNEAVDGIFSLYRLKVIVVDEAQDLNPTQFLFVKTLSDALNIPLIMVGDTNQAIFSFQGSDPGILHEYDYPTYSLIMNYRSSAPIIDFCNCITPFSEREKMIVSDEAKGHHPVEVHVVHKDALRSEILSKIQYFRNLGLAYEEIAILGPVKLSGIKFSNIGLQAVANIFEIAQIPYNLRYRRPSLIQEEYDSFDPVAGQINLMTIHGSKGLEFRAVILLNFHFNTMGRIPTEHEYQESKFLWYVGCSRAKQYLSIFVSDSKSIHPLFTQVQNLPTLRVYGKPIITELNFNKDNFTAFRENIPVTKLLELNFLNSKEYSTFRGLFRDFGPARIIYHDSKLVNSQLDSLSTVSRFIWTFI